MEEVERMEQRRSSSRTGSTCRLWPTLCTHGQPETQRSPGRRSSRFDSSPFSSFHRAIVRQRDLKKKRKKKRGPSDETGNEQRCGDATGWVGKERTDGTEIPTTAKQPSTRRPRSTRRPLANATQTKRPLFYS